MSTDLLSKNPKTSSNFSTKKSMFDILASPSNTIKASKLESISDKTMFLNDSKHP